MAKREVVKTKCCGRIEKCRPPKKCLLTYVLGGGGNCVTCGWIWNMMPGREATPISVADMKAAHS